jgi:hypothetical protein
MGGAVLPNSIGEFVPEAIEYVIPEKPYQAIFPTSLFRRR